VEEGKRVVRGEEVMSLSFAVSQREGDHSQVGPPQSSAVRLVGTVSWPQLVVLPGIPGSSARAGAFCLPWVAKRLVEHQQEQVVPSEPE